MLIKNLFRYWSYQVFSPGTVLREKYESFKTLLEYDKAAHDFMAVLEDIYYTPKKCDFQAVVKNYGLFSHAVSNMVEELLKMCPSSYWELRSYFKKFDFYVRFMLATEDFDFSPPFVIAFDKISSFSEKTAGKKAFSLSLVNRKLHLPVPNGFVITTNAFHYFMELNDLKEKINEKLADLDINNFSSLENTASGIEQLILNGIVPEDIELAVEEAVQDLENKNEIDLRFALRSSAVKEDGKNSFAGQYKTILNVGKNNILKNYKRVIAGKYSERALFYRVSHGILDDETPMAVLVLEMVDSLSSGVLYTCDTEKPSSENLLINSVWGQGELLVDGKVSPDIIEVSKQDVSKIVSIKTGEKSKYMVLDSDDQTRILDTDQDEINRLSLDELSLLTLARWGLSIEEYFGKPQDIEWCKDKSDRLFILQSRPLNIDPDKITAKEKETKVIHNNDHEAYLGSGTEYISKKNDKSTLVRGFFHDNSHDADLDLSPDWLKATNEKSVLLPGIFHNKIICSGGESICTGTGFGHIHRLDSLSSVDNVSMGSVLVVRHALPELVTLMDKVSAVIIEKGSRASHFASIAREFNIPAIVNIKNGFCDLVHGQEVTVDAEKCVVYDGIIESMLKEHPEKEDFFKNSSFMVKLRYVMNFCAKLKLTDPESPAFIPEGCRSLHDIIRFVHETAMKEMFSIGSRKGSRKKGAKQLISKIPMLFYLLDVGNGIEEHGKNKKVLRPDDIASLPLKAVLKGLSNPGICWSETTHFDWEEYDRIVMAGGIISADSPMFGSYAVMSEEYLNVNFRFGYHFVIIDTICSPLPENNYILFRFSGGGGTPQGRALRANFIKGILTQFGFMVDIKSDLIDAELKNGSLNVIEEALDMTGRLLGTTKLMDMYLKDGLDIKLMTEDFMNGRYDFRSAVDKGSI